MSMLSAQVDRLRKAAQTYRNLGNYEAEKMLLDAADTIWELRESVHRERAEAERLREELEAAKHDLSLFSGELVASKLENAKLRKLVRMMWLACKSEGIVGGLYTYPKSNSTTDVPVRFEQLMRELGIEVKG